MNKFICLQGKTLSLRFKRVYLRIFGKLDLGPDIMPCLWSRFGRVHQPLSRRANPGGEEVPRLIPSHAIPVGALRGAAHVTTGGIWNGR